MNIVDSLTQPAGPLSEVGIFGHPFHGLVVKSGPDFGGTGTLTLPNTATKSYRMPDSADCWEIALDGVPAVSRTTTEAAADAAAGHQWFDTVIVSGAAGQVYGKYPGSNSPRWYWRDGAGKVWCITILNTGPGALLTEVQIDVRPFGRIGAGAIAPVITTIAHGLAMNSALWSYITTIGGIIVLPRICDIKSDGSAAIACITALHPSSFDDQGVTTRVSCPFAFFEISLSTGLDGWPVPTLTALRNNEATLGSRSSSASSSPSFSRVAVNDTEMRWVGTLSTSTDYSVTGRILSMMYGAGGTPVEIACSLTNSASRTEVWTAENLPDTSAFTHTNTYSTDIAISFSGTYAGTPFMAETAAPNESLIIDLVPMGDVAAPTGYTSGMSAFDLSVLAHLLPIGRDIQQTGLPDPTFLFVVPHAYTARVFGSIIRTPSLPTAFDYGTVHHPSGTTSGGSSETTSSNPSVYRSYNPHTGALSARSSTPVCYV